MNGTDRKKIIITGATGFIGKQLVKSIKEHYSIVICSRNTKNASKIFSDIKSITYCNQNSEEELQVNIEGAYAIINLAGENVGNKRWTKRQRANILFSRINIGDLLTSAIKKANKKPEVFIQSSATGYYGNTGDNAIDETARGASAGFLTEVTRRWEKSTSTIKGEMRYVILRLGIVLGKDGGLLKRILLPLRYFTGGYPGKGNQWISWIHIKDAVDAVLFMLDNRRLSGVYNVTAPEPVRFRYLARVAGNIIKRPVWLPVPEIILILLFGRRAEELFLASSRVYPLRLLDEGFRFKYNTIDKALNDILK